MSLTEDEIIKAKHPVAEAAEMFFKNYAAIAALVVLSFIILMAIFGPTLYTVDPFGCLSRLQVKKVFFSVPIILEETY